MNAGWTNARKALSHGWASVTFLCFPEHVKVHRGRLSLCPLSRDLTSRPSHHPQRLSWAPGVPCISALLSSGPAISSSFQWVLLPAVQPLLSLLWTEPSFWFPVHVNLEVWGCWLWLASPSIFVYNCLSPWNRLVSISSVSQGPGSLP